MQSVWTHVGLLLGRSLRMHISWEGARKGSKLALSWGSQEAIYSLSLYPTPQRFLFTEEFSL